MEDSRGRSADIDAEACDLLGTLVGIDSSDPGAYEGRIGTFIRGWLDGRVREHAGAMADAVEVETCEALPGRRDLVARIPGTSDEPRLAIICHMDTVTLGEGWSTDTPPLGAVVRDGTMYGRGTCDMKGGLACALLAFDAALVRLGEQGHLPRRELSLILTVDEETNMRGIEAAIDAGWVSGRDWVLDTEPTDGEIQGAHKGRVWFKVEMRGVTAHASTPWKGADAIAATAEAVRSIRNGIGRLPTNDQLGRSTVTFGMVEGGYQPYVVPDGCTTWIDMRLVPPTDEKTVRRIVEEAIDLAEREVPGVSGSYEVTGSRPAIARDDTSPLLAAVRKACTDAGWAQTRVGTFNGYTDGAVVAATTGNTNCLSYGPGSLEMAHKPNEFVPLADLARCRAVYTRLVDGVIW